jgi:hypothetical protein
MSTINHMNPATNREFKAVNLEVLTEAMHEHGYVAAHWATYNQWQTVTRKVRNSEKGVMLEGASGFQWRVFNVAQTDVMGDVSAAPAPTPTPAPAPKASPKATAKASARKSRRAEASNEWSRHPVTGYPMRVPAGRTIADVVPFANDPDALKAVGREYAHHGRIGAAQIIVGLERDGHKSDASQYLKGLTKRRREEGAVRYSYGPVSLSREALATTRPEPAAPVETAPTPIATAAPAPVSVPSLQERASAANVSPEQLMRQTPRLAPTSNDLTPPAHLQRTAKPAPVIRQPAAPAAGMSARAAWIARIKSAVSPRPQA